jgi:hypothetical protein
MVISAKLVWADSQAQLDCFCTQRKLAPLSHTLPPQHPPPNFLQLTTHSEPLTTRIRFYLYLPYANGFPLPLMQCCGSMTFWCGSRSGSRSADPCLWLRDPDADPYPSIFIIDLQDANKKLIFKKKFSCIPYRYSSELRSLLQLSIVLSVWKKFLTNMFT